jgi:fatty-acid desaturase
LPENRRIPVLIEPCYGYSVGGDAPRRPRLPEVLREWLDAVNFVKKPRGLAALSFAFHVSTFLVFIVYCRSYASWKSFAFLAASVFFLATVYNTVWYHRYCSHTAFAFASPLWSKLFLWTNPFFYREENYAIAHRIHHQFTDKAGDPYGPHLSWLASYLAIDSIQKVNPALSRKEFDTLKKGLSHIGFRPNSYERFQRSGSVEKPSAFLLRSVAAQMFWGVILFAAAGPAGLATWYAGVFITFFLIRSFNWHGHGGQNPRKKKPGWEFDDKNLALNQRFYGYLASEWHDNHHKYPMSANNGFLPGQFDLAFKIIQLLHKSGVINHYTDAAPRFGEEFRPRSAQR